MNLTNKLAIVTGVSKGIGYATVEALLDKGAIVAGWGRTAPKISHPNFQFYLTDVQQSESVQDSYDATTNDLGKDVAVLINNAGFGFRGDFDKTPTDTWTSMFKTNVDGIFYCSRLVIPQMKSNDQGHIINIASIAGTLSVPNMVGYAGSKHAVRGISHAMYMELREYGIKVTAIYPGSVKTNFFDKVEGIDAHDNMMMPEDIAGTILHTLESSDNYHHVDIEVRPLRPKGKQNA